MKSFRIALLSALGAAAFAAFAAFAAPASAWPYIDVTASEVLSVDPPRVRTTFELSFAGYHPYFDPGYFEVTPLDPAALHNDECGGPPLWVCGSTTPAATGGVFFSAYHGSGAPYAPVNIFSIVTDRAAPCVRIDFYDPVLVKAPAPAVNADYRIEACLLVDAPVPVGPRTWGHLKATYR
jgi:hypothetical protein